MKACQGRILVLACQLITDALSIDEIGDAQGSNGLGVQVIRRKPGQVRTEFAFFGRAAEPLVQCARGYDRVAQQLLKVADVVARVAGRLPILIDGGIRRGTDVLKALALGADAVLVGRPVVHGLTVAGALGVSHVLRLLRDEFEVAMALTGCNTLDQIVPRLVLG